LVGPPVGPLSYSAPYLSVAPRQIDRLELATADVQSIFGSQQSRSNEVSVNGNFTPENGITPPHAATHETVSGVRDSDDRRNVGKDLVNTQVSPRRYPLAESPPGQRAPAYAYQVLFALWGREGPPRSMSIRQITEDANKRRQTLPANKDYPAPTGGLSESTVRRVLGLSK
jgi:hypothetical protein